MFMGSGTPSVVHREGIRVLPLCLDLPHRFPKEPTNTLWNRVHPGYLQFQEITGTKLTPKPCDVY